MPFLPGYLLLSQGWQQQVVDKESLWRLWWVLVNDSWAVGHIQAISCRNKKTKFE